MLDIGGRIQPYRPLIENRLHRYIAIDPLATGLVDAVAIGEYLPFRSEIFDLVMRDQGVGGSNPLTPTTSSNLKTKSFRILPFSYATRIFAHSLHIRGPDPRHHGFIPVAKGEPLTAGEFTAGDSPTPKARVQSGPPSIDSWPTPASVSSTWWSVCRGVEDAVRGAAHERVSKIEDLRQNGSETTPERAATEALERGRRGVDRHAAADDLEDAADVEAIFRNVTAPELEPGKLAAR